jgi:hypothetical protein
MLTALASGASPLYAQNTKGKFDGKTGVHLLDTGKTVARKPIDSTKNDAILGRLAGRFRAAAEKLYQDVNRESPINKDYFIDKSNSYYENVEAIVKEAKKIGMDKPKNLPELQRLLEFASTKAWKDHEYKESDFLVYSFPDGPMDCDLSSTKVADILSSLKIPGLEIWFENVPAQEHAFLKLKFMGKEYGIETATNAPEKYVLKTKDEFEREYPLREDDLFGTSTLETCVYLSNSIAIGTDRFTGKYDCGEMLDTLNKYVNDYAPLCSDEKILHSLRGTLGIRQYFNTADAKYAKLAVNSMSTLLQKCRSDRTFRWWEAAPSGGGSELNLMYPGSMTEAMRQNSRYYGLLREGIVYFLERKYEDSRLSFTDLIKTANRSEEVAIAHFNRAVIAFMENKLPDIYVTTKAGIDVSCTVFDEEVTDARLAMLVAKAYFCALKKDFAKEDFFLDVAASEGLTNMDLIKSWIDGISMRSTEAYDALLKNPKYCMIRGNLTFADRDYAKAKEFYTKVMENTAEPFDYVDAAFYRFQCSLILKDYADAEYCLKCASGTLMNQDSGTAKYSGIK